MLNGRSRLLSCKIAQIVAFLQLVANHSIVIVIELKLDMAPIDA